jgi:hypothetical protein
MQNAAASVMQNAASRLIDSGLPSQWYMIPAYTGYGALTAGRPTDVYCLEAHLGEAHGKPEYDAYAVAQLFLPNYPSLALITLVECRKADRQPGLGQPVYSAALDKKFSRVFLRTMHTAFNALDPTRQGRGLLVQAYHAKITLGDLVGAGINTGALILRFKRDGQLAQIAVDFDDPLTTLVAGVVRPCMRLAGGDVHYIPRTKTLSSLQIPIRDSGGAYHAIGDNSTALDRGLEIAKTYFDHHYQKFGYVACSNEMDQSL